MRLTQTGRSENSIKLQDAQAKAKALTIISNRADQLFRQGREKDFQQLFETMRQDPNNIYGIASNLELYAISPEGMQEAALMTPLLTRAELTQNARFDELSLDEKKEHSIKLMGSLDEALQESTHNFALNEAILSQLSTDTQETPEYLDLLTQNPGSIASPNPLTLSPAKRIDSEQKLSPVQKYIAQLSPAQRQEEISKRLKLRSTFTEQRKHLLEKQASAMTLIQAGKPELVHDVFNPEGPQLDETQNVLRQDNELEQNFAQMQESLLGLSPEEQTVRARDFVTKELQKARSDLRLLDKQNEALTTVAVDQRVKAEIRLGSEDQKIINGLTAQHIERKADLLFDLHDKLSKGLNNGDYKSAVEAVDATGQELAQDLYTYGEPELSSNELRNRDLARTPKEEELLQNRLVELEEQFKALTNTQVKIAKSFADDGAKELKAVLVRTDNSFSLKNNVYNPDTIARMMGNQDLDFERIENSQQHAGRILDSLIEGQRDLKSSKAEFTQKAQLENYQRALENIIAKADTNLENSKQEYQQDSRRTSQHFNELDNFYGNTEAAIEFARDSAVIAAATIATGGAAAALSGAGWGIGAASLGGLAAGTGAGTGVGLLSNTAEALGRDANGMANPYGDIAGKTYKDFKTSLTTAAATTTGIGATKYLAKARKWGRLASSLGGGGASSFVSTSLSHGIQAVENKVNTGEFNLDPKQYAIDLMWNTGSSLLGSGIGSKFGELQEAAGKDLVRQAILHGGEEVVSVAGDLATTLARDGEITGQGVLESMRGSVVGRAQSHFAHANNPVNKLAQSIKDQDLDIKVTDDLPEGMNGRSRVTVNPDGSRSVEVELSRRVVEAAQAGDRTAREIILEETFGHAKENPIDPLVKQADGSHKAMDQEKYHALRARQELIARSTGAAKLAKADERSISETKQGSKETIKEMSELIKSGDYRAAMAIAEANGIHSGYLARYEVDYEANAGRNPETEAVDQTSYSTETTEQNTKATTEPRITSLDDPRMREIIRELDAMQDADGIVVAELPGDPSLRPQGDATSIPRRSDNDAQAENFKILQEQITEATSLKEIDAIRADLEIKGEDHPVSGATSRKKLNDELIQKELEIYQQEIAKATSKEDIDTIRERLETVKDGEDSLIYRSKNRKEITAALDNKEQAIKTNDKLTAQFGSTIPPALARLTAPLDPASPNYKSDLKLRRILLSEDTTGADATLRDALLDNTSKANTIKQIAIEAITTFNEVDKNRAIKLLGTSRKKAIQVFEVMNMLHRPTTANQVGFAAAERINTKLNEMGITTSGDLPSQKLVKAILDDAYPSSDFATLESNVKKAYEDWYNSLSSTQQENVNTKPVDYDAKGPLHELRTQIALEQMVADGEIRSFIMAENVVNNPSVMTGDKSKGLDALGIDVVIQLNNGDITVAQIKSSPGGVNDNYSATKSYKDANGDRQRIQKRFNHAIDVSGQSLSALHSQIINPAAAIPIPDLTTTNQHSSMMRPGVTTNPERGQAIMNGSLFGNKSLNSMIKKESGNEKRELSKQLMQILEDVIIEK